MIIIIINIFINTKKANQIYIKRLEEGVHQHSGNPTVGMPININIYAKKQFVFIAQVSSLTQTTNKSLTVHALHRQEQENEDSIYRDLKVFMFFDNQQVKCQSTKEKKNLINGMIYDKLFHF